jgi:threonyl-tRNA synthetase
VQLTLLPVGPTHRRAAEDAAARFRSAGLRVRVESEGTLGLRIRDCRRRRDGLIGVIGDAEIAADRIAVQDPGADVRAVVAVAELAEALAHAVAGRLRSVVLASDRSESSAVR